MIGWSHGQAHLCGRRVEDQLEQCDAAEVCRWKQDLRSADMEIAMTLACGSGHDAKPVKFGIQ